MNALLAILVITFVLILTAGLAFFQMFKPKIDLVIQPGAAAKRENKPKIRFSYFMLPVIILLLSVVAVIFFYPKLPETVNLRPDSGDAANISRFVAVLWAIIPQMLMALIAMVITYGTTKIRALFAQESETGVKQLENILLVMSNMVIIPQLILLVAMLNIFSYNSFQTNISFVWWISLAVIFIGIAFLSVFFVRTIQKMSKQNK
jgi:heme/copper-type cytochrome/quinol oxidase subunit 2